MTSIRPRSGPKFTKAPESTPPEDKVGESQTILTPPRALKVINVADVEMEDVRWLWYPYIPAGKLTMIEGDPQVGKSFLAMAIAKHLSRGEPLPGQEAMTGLRPQKTLLISTEDDINDTLGPRLLAMEADLKQIYFVTEDFLLDPAGTARLEETMRSLAVSIVFLDPLLGLFGGKRDVNKDNEVREVTNGLVSAARRTGCAVVGIRHFRKQGGSVDVYKGLGSIGISAHARSIVHVSFAKDGKTRLVHAVKTNLGPKGKPLAYEIYNEDEGLPPPSDPLLQRWSPGKFRWVGYTEEAEPPKGKKTSTTPAGLSKAKEFIKMFLANGPQPAMTVFAEAKLLGIAERTLKRAKPGLAISQQVNNIWLWALVPDPGPEKEPADGQDGPDKPLDSD